MKMFNNKIIILYFVFQIFLPGSVFATNLFQDEDVIWQAGKNVFIKYAEQDNSKFGENDHPVVLKVEEISKALESLQILDDDRSGSDQEQQSVFTVEQIDMLSQNLAKGLAKANPNQDINFALQKNIGRSFGLKSNRLFVAGRTFYKDEKLNIIIGDYDRAADEGFEAAYDPTRVGIVSYNFDHGRRTKSSKGFKKPIIAVRGVENKQLKETQRTDWLVIDLKLVSEASDLRARTRKTEEQARKRKELMELLGSEEASPSHPAAVLPATVPATEPGPAAATVPATVPTTGIVPAIATVPSKATAPAATTRSFEERLTTLNQLRDKGLISDEEYAMKRKQILEDL